MNVEIGTEALIFLFWEYLFQIFGILSLQCRHQKWWRNSRMQHNSKNAKKEGTPVTSGMPTSEETPTSVVTLGC
jgi:hypothetical protein